MSGDRRTLRTLQKKFSICDNGEKQLLFPSSSMENNRRHTIAPSHKQNLASDMLKPRELRSSSLGDYGLPTTLVHAREVLQKKQLKALKSSSFPAMPVTPKEKILPETLRPQSHRPTPSRVVSSARPRHEVNNRGLIDEEALDDSFEESPPPPRREKSTAPVNRYVKTNSMPSLPLSTGPSYTFQQGSPSGGKTNTTRHSLPNYFQSSSPPPPISEVTPNASNSSPTSRKKPGQLAHNEDRGSASHRPTSLKPLTHASLSSRLQLPGLPVLTRSSPAHGNELPYEEDHYFSFQSPKKLHDRRWIIVSNVHRNGEREPCARCLAKGVGVYNGKRCVRVGGGFLIYDENKVYFLDENANIKEIRQRGEDGSIVLEDGSVVRGDGSRVLPGGRVLPLDPSADPPGGYYIDDGGHLAQKSSASKNSMSSTRSDGDDAAPSRDPIPPQTDQMLLKSEGMVKGGTSGEEQKRTHQGVKSDERGSIEAFTSPPHVSSDSVLAKGEPPKGVERVLDDGSRVCTDGSMVLPDGTVLAPEDAKALARKRDRRKQARQDHPEELDLALRRREDETDAEYQARARDAGYDEKEVAASLAFTRKDPPAGSKKRNILLPTPASSLMRDDPGRPEIAYLGKGNHSLALDYLSQYCILSVDQLTAYKAVFDQLDLDGNGFLDRHEMQHGLKTVNKNIISAHETRYVEDILEVAKEPSLSFKMFAVIAALSERVVGLDSVMKGVLNGLDLDALLAKLDKCKNLFYLLDEGKEGIVEMDLLLDELHAGRISLDHEEIIIKKFNDQGKTFMDFMDYLTYCPLFVQIHDTITLDPFNNERNL